VGGATSGRFRALRVLAGQRRRIKRYSTPFQRPTVRDDNAQLGPLAPITPFTDRVTLCLEESHNPLSRMGLCPIMRTKWCRTNNFVLTRFGTPCSMTLSVVTNSRRHETAPRGWAPDDNGRYAAGSSQRGLRRVKRPAGHATGRQSSQRGETGRERSRGREEGQDNVRDRQLPSVHGQRQGGRSVLPDHGRHAGGRRCRRTTSSADHGPLKYNGRTRRTRHKGTTMTQQNSSECQVWVALVEETAPYVEAPAAPITVDLSRGNGERSTLRTRLYRKGGKALGVLHAYTQWLNDQGYTCVHESRDQNVYGPN
jgi:hypothetical protein